MMGLRMRICFNQYMVEDDIVQLTPHSLMARDAESAQNVIDWWNEIARLKVRRVAW